jgi:hypothetical protein
MRIGLNSFLYASPFTTKSTKLFAKFKQWLLNIYQTIKGLGQPINEDIRGVFDRMLVAEPQRTVIAPERPGGPSLADIHEADANLTEPHEAAAAAPDQGSRQGVRNHEHQYQTLVGRLADPGAA